jgi:hypothetical protein
VTRYGGRSRRVTAYQLWPNAPAPHFPEAGVSRIVRFATLIPSRRCITAPAAWDSTSPRAGGPVRRESRRGLQNDQSRERCSVFSMASVCSIRTPVAATLPPFAATTSNWRDRQSRSTYRCRDLHCRNNLARSARRTAHRTSDPSRYWRGACDSLRRFRGKESGPTRVARRGCCPTVGPTVSVQNCTDTGRQQAQNLLWRGAT